jgi:hypothetical protein
MNFHPDILSHSAFLDKPRSRREFYRVIGLPEERFFILEGGDRLVQGVSRGSKRVSSPGGPPRNPDVSRKARERVPLVDGIVASWVTLEVAVLTGIHCRETGNAPGVDRFPA